MKVNEIIMVPNQDIPTEHVARLLARSQHIGQHNGFDLHYAENNNQRVLLLSMNQTPAAYAGFISRNNDTIWQAQNAQTYLPYKGQKLVAELYGLVKTKWGKSLQSDMLQTESGKKLWTVTLPNIGIKPMILDTETEYIIDPATVNVNDFVYSNRRYCWIVESHDFYPSQNMFVENGLLFPYTGLWYIEEKDKQ